MILVTRLWWAGLEGREIAVTRILWAASASLVLATTTIEPKMPIPGIGWYATCAEPGGLVFGLIQPTSDVPEGE